MLQDRSILVTGGTRGIGQSIVETLAQAGAHVSFTYSSSEEVAQQIVQRLPNTSAYKLQFGTEYEAEQIEQIINHHPNLHGFVNNAGITHDGLMLLQNEHNWHKVIDTNLLGAYRMTKALLPALLKNKGKASIVYIASVAGLIGVAGQTNYSVSKSGLIGLAKSLSKELAGKKIRVNSISPGYICSDMTDKLHDKLKEQFRQSIPLKRFGQVEEVANVVEFLLSDKSSYITSQNIVVDGGLIG